MRIKKRGDIDAEYHAIRARLNNTLGTATATVTPPTTVAPHTHSADQIGMQETVSTGAYLSADDVQEGLEELDSEKLARSGIQPMLGNLNMDHNDIDNIVNADIEGNATVAVNIQMTGGSGFAQITGVRVITMDGDNIDDEAKIGNLERVIFNNEPTASSIELPSRIEMNAAVVAGVNYTAAEGIMSWDSVEGTLVVHVASGAGVALVALGWMAKLMAVV